MIVGMENVMNFTFLIILLTFDLIQKVIILDKPDLMKRGILIKAITHNTAVCVLCLYSANKQYYEKLFTLREVTYERGRIKEGSKGIWLIYFLYKDKYRIFKPVETIVRKGLR
jgi:hypothetical protein